MMQGPGRGRGLRLLIAIVLDDDATIKYDVESMDREPVDEDDEDWDDDDNSATDLGPGGVRAKGSLASGCEWRHTMHLYAFDAVDQLFMISD